MDLTEQTSLPAQSEENAEFYWLRSWYPTAIVRVNSLKYIERLEIELATAELGRSFIDLCDELWFGHRFISENVRWSRSDEYLAVIGATFVRWKPVED